MKIINVTPGLLPIPPNGWGAVEKIIWETHNNLLKLGHQSEILYLNQVKDYDIVHIHVANLANMAHEMGIPYYFTMHDHHAYLYGKDSPVYKENLQAIKNAQKAFVPAKFLVDYFEGVPEYFSHGVNTDEFLPGIFKQHKLLCVANNGFIHNQAEDRKGFGYAIEAAKQLRLPITIAGPSNNKNYFEKFPSDYDKLTILYDLNEEQLKDLYQEHTIFLHPSVLEAGHPNLTLLEAMASGLPVIGTFENNNSLNGMVVANRNTDEIISALKLLLDPTAYVSYAKKARHQALKLSWKNRTKELLKYYTPSMKSQLISSYNNTKKLLIPSKEYSPEFNINFINGAFFEIKGDIDKEYKITFINKKTNVVEHQSTIRTNYWVKANKSYCVDWKIQANDGETIFEYDFDPSGQRVYIALDSKALGDTIAWFPYVEEFRKKHNCEVIASTFWNYLFEKEYPNIKFVNPGDTVHNLYAMYTIGWFYNKEGEFDSYKIPNYFSDQPLQKTASDILGLEYKEVKPKISLPKNEKENIISIAIHGTAQAKYWNNLNGWQELVDYLKEKGYRVILISKEEDGYMGNIHPKGVEHMSGNVEETINLLSKSKMFIGISSGLSWLSWVCNTPTVIISGFTDPVTEFNCTRISPRSEICQGCLSTHRLDAGDWNWCPKHKNTKRQFECSKTITSQDVIDKIKNML